MGKSSANNRSSALFWLYGGIAVPLIAVIFVVIRAEMIGGGDLALMIAFMEAGVFGLIPIAASLLVVLLVSLYLIFAQPEKLVHGIVGLLFLLACLLLAFQ